jgi:transposase-like protein
MRKIRSRRSWSSDQKRTLTNEARRLIASGKTLHAASRTLNVRPVSLALWMRQYPETALQRVEVVDDERIAELVLVVPGGYRVQVLTVETLVRVLEGLR